MPPNIGGAEIENITVVENNPVTMLCDVDAFPPPQITWFKNARPLLLGPGIRLALNNTKLDILWAQVPVVKQHLLCCSAGLKVKFTVLQSREEGQV